MTEEKLWALPPAWTWVSFRDVAEVRSSLRDPAATPNAVHIAPNHIESGAGHLLGRGTVAGDEVSSPKHAFCAGQVLYSKIRPYLAKAVLVDFEGLCSADMYPVSAKLDRMEPRFLHRWLVSPDFTEFASKSQGRTVLPKINQDALYRKPVPLPPLGEQKRIADKVEALLARVYACRERLDRVPAILKRFRQSVLAAATSGELTRDWRAENPLLVDAEPLASTVHAAHAAAGGHRLGNAAAPTDGVHNLAEEMFPEGWMLLTLRDVVRPERPITYGILKPGPEVDDGVPYVRVADFPNDRLNLSTIRKTSRAMDEEFRRSRLRQGDLLLSIRGTVGRLVVVPAELEHGNITQDTARLSIQPAINPAYVLWALRSDLAQRRMRAAVKGVAVRGINIGDVRALQIPLPSRSEQEEIVRRVENLLGLADRLMEGLQKAFERVETLTPSILANAFRGELVPQDPNDEPASVLLARIRADRDAATKAEQHRSAGPTAPRRNPGARGGSRKRNGPRTANGATT